MAAGSSARIIRSPGRLVVNPTEAFASGTFPFGGYEIGRANQCQLRPVGQDYAVQFEALGAVGDILEGPNRWVFACFARGWDDDAVRLLLQDGHEEGAETQHAVFKVPGTHQPGTSALPRSVSLAYVPDDTTHGAAVLIYRAVPAFDGSIAFARKTELGIPLTFECLLDTQGRILAIGRLADLEL